MEKEPGVDLAQVEQVLIARHMLTPSLPVNLTNKSIGKVTDTFIVQQLNADRNDSKWEVNLSNTLVEFINIHGGERFVIEREHGRMEFQFQHGSFLLMSERSAALVRGKLFDFGRFKPLLEAWLPPLSQMDLQKDLRFWGWVMVLVGAISLLQTTTFGPILGGLLVILGLINFLESWRGTLIINGILLLAAGGFSLYGIFESFQSLVGSVPVVTAFWAFLGLFELLWGYQEFHKFTKYRPQA